MNNTDQKLTQTRAPVRLSTVPTISDKIASVMCRISNKFRMTYKTDPGLYAVGNPDKNSPVLVTANYKLTVNILRAALKGRDVWILVIDTRGINVWCAAGKGTFCTKEIVKQIVNSDLSSQIAHRQLILPQLSASGVNASKLHKESGFTARFGPVRALDLPQYIDNGCCADSEMRRVRFGLFDRAKIVPMEVIPAFTKILLFLFVVAVLFGITSEGIMYKRAITGAFPFIIAGLTALLTGSILTPLFLPIIPFRAFTLKGFFIGMIGAIVIISLLPACRNDLFLLALCLISVPSLSSYLAFLFTGSTTFTSPSGVKKELKTAWPLYLTSAGVSVVLFVLVLVKSWGIL